MELLLLLSAFLTALTGAITGARPVQGVAAERTVQVAAVAEQAARRVVGGLRPVQGWPAEAPVALRVAVISVAVIGWEQRRRE